MEWKVPNMGQKTGAGKARGRRDVSMLVGWTQGLIRFFLAAALAGGEALPGCSPFGLALVGASGAGLEGFFALVGAVLGYLLSQGLESGLRYAACSVLIFSVAFAFLI